MLIGTSTQPGAFTEDDRGRDGRARRPADHHAAVQPDLACRGPARRPDRLDRGRALIATGSPFDPVTYRGVRYEIAQANNALIFPGLGLGVTVARARRVSDGMLAAAADALAGLSDANTPGAGVLPPVTSLRRYRPRWRPPWPRPRRRGPGPAQLDDPAKQVARPCGARLPHDRGPVKRHRIARPVIPVLTSENLAICAGERPRMGSLAEPGRGHPDHGMPHSACAYAPGRTVCCAKTLRMA